MESIKTVINSLVTTNKSLTKLRQHLIDGSVFEISKYAISESKLLRDLSQEERLEAQKRLTFIFEKNYGAKQDPEKIVLLLRRMEENGYTVQQMEDAVNYHLDHSKNYYDKWVIGQILDFPQDKVYTQRGMFRKVEKENYAYEDFQSFRSLVDKKIYYWDLTKSPCPYEPLKWDEN